MYPLRFPLAGRIRAAWCLLAVLVSGCADRSSRDSCEDPKCVQSDAGSGLHAIVDATPDGDGPCGQDTHDDGTGTCITAGRCAEGFTLLPDERCAGFVEATQPDTDLWAGQFPSPRVVQIDEGQVLLAGGRWDEHSHNDAFVYSSVLDTWEAVSSMVMVREEHALVATLTGALAIGGRNDDGLLAGSESYDPTRKRFFRGPFLDRGFADGAAARGPDDRVLACGGESEYSNELYHSSCFILDDSSLGVVTAAMSTPRAGFVLVSLNDGDVLALGGDSGCYPCGQPNDLSYRIAEVFSFETLRWTHAASPPVDLTQHVSAGAISSGLVIALGSDGNNAVALTYDPGADRWAELATLDAIDDRTHVVPIGEAALLMIGTHVYLFSPELDVTPVSFDGGRIYAATALDDSSAIIIDQSGAHRFVMGL